MAFARIPEVKVVKVVVTDFDFATISSLFEEASIHLVNNMPTLRIIKVELVFTSRYCKLRKQVKARRIQHYRSFNTDALCAISSKENGE